MRYDVNLSILFTDLPVLERPAAAREAGFDAVEFWWPFAEAVPATSEVEAFEAAVRDAGVALVGLNFFAGDMAAGDRGLVAWPGREAEFRANVEIAAGIAARLGCRTFNALHGSFPTTPAALENLRYAADVAAEIDATVVVEPLSAAPDYPLRTAADALAVLDAAGRDNLALLADLYHLAVNGDDLDTLTAHVDRIGHVQIADAPGRGEPGTGDLDLEGALAKLEAAGYQGFVGLEYKATRFRDGLPDFDWLFGPKDIA
ncbi:hydroxypyruvate isomerase family protein [Saccharothrix variisporea]|uniref:Hydroxypyruvate isomerase n=1 Tax=Saccharothrix variisporea TaxID=543527 RepID=A0A495XIP3_9PSEU|nr:TIM barrel protein [Saccharothrix variisporea]RKT72996.1 hydroxypyruvate isomerase [Saccharothrix variisporea]